MLTPEPEVRFIVYPTWVGLAVDVGGTLVEPMDPEYKRGQIFWRVEGDRIVGGGGVTAPAGEYHGLVYAHTPDGPTLPGSVRLPHALPIHNTCVVEVDPITQGDDLTLGNQRYRR